MNWVEFCKWFMGFRLKFEPFLFLQLLLLCLRLLTPDLGISIQELGRFSSQVLANLLVKNF